MYTSTWGVRRHGYHLYLRLPVSFTLISVKEISSSAQILVLQRQNY